MKQNLSGFSCWSISDLPRAAKRKGSTARLVFSNNQGHFEVLDLTDRASGMFRQLKFLALTGFISEHDDFSTWGPQISSILLPLR
jgi:hypothetical protein